MYAVNTKKSLIGIRTLLAAFESGKISERRLSEYLFTYEYEQQRSRAMLNPLCSWPKPFIIL